MGKQKFATFGALIFYYVIGLPLEVTFAFPLKFGSPGLWMGLAIGIAIMVIFFQYVIDYKYDWNEIAVEF